MLVDLAREREELRRRQAENAQRIEERRRRLKEIGEGVYRRLQLAAVKI